MNSESSTRLSFDTLVDYIFGKKPTTENALADIKCSPRVSLDVGWCVERKSRRKAKGDRTGG